MSESVNADAPTQSTFDDKDTRKDDMAERIDAWVASLADATDEAADSEHFQEWLDVQSRFHDYSANNTLLIHAQCPEATKVAGFNTWKNEFDRYVKKGESAIWIWGPIIAKRCPACENAQSYHDAIGCDDDTDPDEWGRGLVGFKPVSVFDISQTEGEPLPELDTAAHGDAEGLADDLLEVAGRFGIDATVTDPGDWAHGSARGVSDPRTGDIDIKDRDNDADKSRTIVHEIAHSLIHRHGDDDAPAEREAREVEAEATAYVVGKHLGLDVSNSAFYLASWAGEDTDLIRQRLDRISSTAQDIIDALVE